MGESSVKPIQINPELFNLKRNKTQKNKSLKVRNIQPNKLKNDLLNRIKNYKKEKKELENLDKKENDLDNNLDNQNSENNKPDEFMDSINFLKKLTVNKEEINDNLVINEQPMIVKNDINKNENSNDNHPGYGCLKNGSMPTFREWKRMTLKNKDNNHLDLSNEPPINFKNNNISNILPDNVIHNEINNQINNEINNKINENKKLNQKKNITYKYSLGKKNRKVSVLIKNNKTRKKIMDEHIRMKQVNLHEMKKYLKRHNFLKSGSYAPSDVIKKMYEECLLSGNLKNISTENIHSNLEEN